MPSTCMNSSLYPNEYNISKGILTTIYSSHKFNLSEYENISSDGIVFLCFPFSQQFVDCVKWKLKREDFTQTPNKSIITRNITSTTYEVGNYDLRPADNSVFVCIPFQLAFNPFTIEIVFVIAWILSIISLLATLILSFIRSKQYAGSGSISINCHMVTMCMYYVFCLIYYMPPATSDANLRLVIGFCWNYMAISTACWLNVYSFDAWRRLESKRMLIYLTRNRPSNLQVFLQCLYGWGFSLVVVATFTTTGVVDFIGERNKGSAKIVYSIVIAILYFSNIVLFIVTVFNLHKMGSDVAIANCKIARRLIGASIKLMIISVLISISTSINCITSGDIISSVGISIQGICLFMVLGFNILLKLIKEHLRNICKM